MSKYTPHTSADVKAMLDAVGLDSLDALYADVPEKLMLKKLGLGQGMSQAAVERKYEKTASENKVFDTVLRGCGAYDHFIPAAVRSLAARSRFRNRIYAISARNKSGYSSNHIRISDAHVRTYRHGCFQCFGLRHGHRRRRSHDYGLRKEKQGFGSRRGQSRNRCRGENLRLRFGLRIGGNSPQKRSCDLDALEKALDDNTACVVAQSPNFFGLIEDMKAVGDKAHEKGAKFVYIFNPVSATVLVTPKECGADIAVGDGQPLGMPLAFGGLFWESSPATPR